MAHTLVAQSYTSHLLRSPLCSFTVTVSTAASIPPALLAPPPYSPISALPTTPQYHTSFGSVIQGGDSAATFAKIAAVESSMLTSSKTARPKSLPLKADCWTGLIGVESCIYIAGVLSRRFLRAQRDGKPSLILATENEILLKGQSGVSSLCADLLDLGYKVPSSNYALYNVLSFCSRIESVTAVLQRDFVLVQVLDKPPPQRTVEQTSMIQWRTPTTRDPGFLNATY